ncbi:DUF1552 domain-containing protein [Polyangium mundeleinium]|uniref:DUF1552 domain-containing protein n=1 Tax=Polyangium mundeleinium TaxID=2995306 RepID=A0ABT5EQR0_9BACT|nr:DUF1552 domain-containing protein [Polyangium mundeleinium]MDC0743095.1 DUF1552 domain-containing protein [Polyangium mundeleinium]
MVKKLNRRMWLRGAAGFTLAIPFLPSLFGKDEAFAAGGPKRFVALATQHGGVWQPRMYPNDTTLTQSTSYAGHDIRRGALALEAANGVASLSPVLAGDSSKLTSALVQKMNVLRGLDVTFYLAHHRGGHLGNYADNDGNGADGQAIWEKKKQTLDQILAWSSKFYPDLGSIRERSIVVGSGGMSHGWSNPGNQTGTIQSVAPENDSLALFNKIFVPPQDPTQTRPPIVDRVLADYKRLRDGTRRLSSKDKQRLDDHMDRVNELDRKLNVSASCGDIQAPASSSIDEWGSSFSVDPEAQKRFWQLMNDVIVAAFACDTCRIVTMNIGDHFSNYVGDWHQDVAHQANVNAERHELNFAGHRRFFEDVYLDLVSKLDALQDASGGSVLDHSLVQWTQESGCVTHDPIEMAVVTAGSADGFFSTGNYCDYRNLQKPASKADGNNLVDSHVGLVYNQWLGTVLQSMGLAPSDYESDGYGGYGLVQLSTEGWYGGYNKYTNAELGVMSEILPFLKA